MQNLIDNGHRRRATLLVVDDLPLNVRLLHDIFCEQHDVHTATSGAEALALCDRLRPDLVLLDVAMPELDGLSVCRMLRDKGSTVPVIFVTAGNDADEEAACWDAGCVDFAAKPVNATTLRKRVAAHLQLKYQADTLRALAFSDGLTGVANRRYLDERLAQAWQACAREQRPLSLLMIDVDWFKRYNDNYGHQAGDDCLRRVAAALAAVARRPEDLVARYGGEEFMCLLPGTGLDGACLVADAMLATVRACAIEHGGSTDGLVSVSIGVAAVQPAPGTTAAELIEQADARLYGAKQAGRGRRHAGP